MDNRRLTKSENKQIAGVCGGIADFLGWDATVVRVVWVLCVLLGGFGVILYLVLWLIMPKAPEQSYQQRMQERLHGRDSG